MASHSETGKRSRVHVIRFTAEPAEPGAAPSDHGAGGVGASGGSLIDGAVARIYIRRDASPVQLRELAMRLKDTAQGGYALGPWFDWTAIEVTSEADLVAIRKTFAPLIDGWRALP